MEINTGINQQDRLEVSNGLSKLLADSYTLYLKTHYYHWNVKGPMFNTLHVMFETHYTELAVAVDDIAERIRALAIEAPGTYKQFSKLTQIEEDEELPNATQMIKNLLTAHETVIRTGRSIYSAVEKASDEATGDLVTQRIQIHEKTAWMLRSLLEE